MVLDPISAIGLAGSVVQFVIYGYQILSKSNELQHAADGTDKDSKIMELVVMDLQACLGRITLDAAPTSTNFSHFRNKSLKLVTDMLAGMEKLKTIGPPSRWKSLRKAFKVVLGKAKVKEWKDTLDQLRSEFNLHIEIDIL